MNCYAEPFLFNKNIKTHQAMPAPITRNIRIIGKSKKNRILFGCRFQASPSPAFGWAGRQQQPAGLPNFARPGYGMPKFHQQGKCVCFYPHCFTCR